MASHPYTLLDVFTDVPLTGNGLAVVHEADTVGDDAMLAFARETRLSETTFVQAATDPEADYRVRIWTVNEELPFAGHPSLGTAVAVALQRGDREARYVQQTHAGLQPIDVLVEADHATASMLQEPADFGAEHDAAPALAAVGLTPDAAHPELPFEVVSTGVPHLLAAVHDPAALADADPDYAALRHVLSEAGALTLYLFAPDLDAGTVRARAFTGSAAMGEDPATGSAAGTLCVFLAARTGVTRIEIEQGVEMGRPSVLRAELDDGRARVGGDIVPVVTGTVRLP
jgi:trans-2,3-dihydro-3-hydroxyanthranilate isomerase